uniref:CobW C-terminal domain-containing protein n=1 Tax=Chromera velia CCMP2878 TaxID=1169474 RepID=A0A0G4FQH9_9ALVE|eukprot:Cvel_18186.t1-p1 / transcript=Cvel_18186.t1 / gene=Cvel_18186 / organism=Chromera_velia_CCMP2878 / gene_product=hypothetical protein / transcript_product=hypothetical protein / location=Cvel_scaffold1492:6355-7738(-) / protein_length=134 / sequence_SO=supercontig / SO=protein_coding / is_pseudo=false
MCRYKGVLAVRGMRSKFVFQGVGMLFSGDFSDIHEWGDDEKRVSTFVFIGKNLNREELVSNFEECKAEENLRFAIGDEVQVATGIDKWSKGKVIKHWDQGNPYKIQLEEEGGGANGEPVWAVMDEDDWIKALGG